MYVPNVECRALIIIIMSVSVSKIRMGLLSARLAAVRQREMSGAESAFANERVDICSKVTVFGEGVDVCRGNKC